MLEHRNPPSRDFLNRRRWAIEQKKKALASLPVPDYAAERATKLAGLKELADALALLPHMAPTLECVRTEISRLEAE